MDFLYSGEKSVNLVGLSMLVDGEKITLEPSGLKRNIRNENIYEYVKFYKVK
jgi:hypothetical protein